MTEFDQNSEKLLKAFLQDLLSGAVDVKVPEGVPCQTELRRLKAMLSEIKVFSTMLSEGELNASLTFKGQIAGSLKSLQASLKHLAWQTRMIADGDLDQRIDFLGEFSTSFNKMVVKLKEAREGLEEKNLSLQRLWGDLQHDLMLAAEAQQSTMNFISDLSFIKSYRDFMPLEVVSGDFYDEFLDPLGNLNIFIGDATGHGTSAALITMMVKMAISYLPYELSTSETLSRLNSQFSNCFPEGRFVSGIFCKVSPNGLLKASNAGHPPLLLLPADKEDFEIFSGTGLALGMFEEEFEEYTELTYQMKQGDRFFLLTDGITECQTERGFFGLEGVKRFLLRDRKLPLEDNVNSMMKFLSKYSFDDDITILGYEFTETKEK